MNYLRVTIRASQAHQSIKGFLATCVFCAVTGLIVSCDRGAPKLPDLEEQADRWVDSIVLDADSEVRYIGKTKDYVITTVSSVKDLDGLRNINVGDDIEGIRIGAIKCSFFKKDAFYGRQQFMWRGRWGCQAGQGKQEVENSTGEEGEKYFDYIYLGPVYLDSKN